MANLSNDIKEIKALLAKTPQTWSQVVANGSKTEKQGLLPNHSKTRGEQLSEIKEERAKYSIALTANMATEEVKKKLDNLSHEEIINQIQQAIDQQATTGKAQRKNIPASLFATCMKFMHCEPDLSAQ